MNCKSVLNRAFILFLTILVSTGMFAQAPQSNAVTDEEIAESNSPVASLNQLSFHDFYTPKLRGVDEPMNTFLLRGVGVFGRQIIRATMPVVNMPGSTSEGYSGGLGDLNIFDAIRISPKTSSFSFAAGPMLVIPTATGEAFGQGKWQIGAAVMGMQHLPGGNMVGVLTTYQASVAGDKDRADVSQLGFQPVLILNAGNGLYFRSAGATWTFDFEGDRCAIPFALGVGKIFKVGSMMVNTFVEPQFMLYSKGVGQPAFQCFFGMNLQWKK